MSTPRDFKTYHFFTDSHWKTGLLDRLTFSDAEGLSPERLLSPVPVGMEDLPAGIRRLATDPYGTAYWVTGDGYLRWRNRDGSVRSHDFEAASGIVKSPRLVFGKVWLWAFRPDSSCLLRYDVESLQQVNVLSVGSGIVDIAADGHEGVWALVQPASSAEPSLHASSGAQTRLCRVDCHGRIEPPVALPDTAGNPRQIVYLTETRRLALLSEDGLAITLLDPGRPAEATTVRLEHESPGFTALHLEGDGRRRLVLVGWERTDGQAELTSSLLLLDAFAARIQRLTADRISGLDPPQPIERAAATGDTVIVATGPRLFWFRFEAGGEGQGAVGTFMTPALHSPDNEALRGWLRAEIEADVPQGCTLSITVFSTDDAALKSRVGDIAGIGTLPPSIRQERIRVALQAGKTTSYSYSANPDPVPQPADTSAQAAVPTQTYAIPLFDHTARWLWLQMTPTAAPDGAVPRIRCLRIIYPDISLAQHIPAIFRGDVTGRDPTSGDPTGFFRQLLGVLETTTQGLDETIARLGALIHPATAQGAWLDFVARWFDLPWDDALPEHLKQSLLRNGASLLASRGTRRCLDLLLKILLPKATVRVIDANIDYGVVLLGGGRCTGSALPAILTGLAPSSAVLSRRTILGKARLAGDASDPVGVVPFIGFLRIDIAAGDEERRAVEDVLQALVLTVIPAGMRLRIRWLPELYGRSGQTLDHDFVLDNPGARRIGVDARLGLLVLAGVCHTRLTKTGIAVGFRLE